MAGIPERLWRVAKGHWELAQDRTDEAESMAAAYEELGAAIRAAQPVRDLSTPMSRPAAGAAPKAASPVVNGPRDPFAVSYELLGMEPGSDLEDLETAYAARLAELNPEQYPEGSAQRHVIDGRRKAVEAAYEKLRDLLNPTETRFEKIEF